MTFRRLSESQKPIQGQLIHHELKILYDLVLFNVIL